MNDQSQSAIKNLKKKIVICLLSSASLTSAVNAQDKAEEAKQPQWAAPVQATAESKTDSNSESVRAHGLFTMPQQSEKPAVRALPLQNKEASTPFSTTVVSGLSAPKVLEKAPNPAKTPTRAPLQLSDPLPIVQSPAQPVMRDRLVTPAGNTEPQLLDPNAPNIAPFPNEDAPRMSPPKASVFDPEPAPTQQSNTIPGSFPSDQLEIPVINDPQPAPVPTQPAPAPFGQSLQVEKPAPIHTPPVQQPAQFQTQTTYDPPASRVSTQQSAAKVTPAQEVVHEVQPGQNYWTISRQHFGTARYFAALAEYNKHRIPRPDRMKPGMFVLVPETEILEQRYPKIAGIVDAQPSPESLLKPGFFIGPGNQPLYRIGKGDTLTEIAETHLGRTARWSQIVGMNRDLLRDGNNLKIGMVLRLPHDASQVSLAPPVE